MTAPNVTNDPPANPENQIPPENQNQLDPARLQAMILAEENRQLREKLEQAVRPIQQAPTNNNPPPQPGEAFNEPERFLGRIQDMIDRSIRPLRESQAYFDRQQRYGALKQKIKLSNPDAAQRFAIIEGLVDQYMESKEPTEENMAESIQRAIGAMVASGAFSTTNAPVGNRQASPAPNQQAPIVNPPTNNNSPAPTNDMLPPHLRPSNSSIQTSDITNETQVDMSQFDENEKRLMREQGLNPRQFLLLKNTPPDQITSKAFYNKLRELK